VPAREIRAAEIADLAGAHEIVQRAEHLFDRGERVEAMELEQVDVVCAQAAQASFNRPQQMPPGRTDIIWAITAAKGRLSRNEHLVAAASDRASQNLLRLPLGIDVGGIKEVEASLQTYVDEPSCLLDTCRAPRLEEFVAATKGPVPKQRAGTLNPEPPNSRYSISVAMFISVGSRFRVLHNLRESA
jgi:hypothetical protein